MGQLGVQPESYLVDYWTETVRAVGARRVVLIHWDDFFRPLSKPLRALPYVADDLDVSLRVLSKLAAQDGVALDMPTVWRREDPWAENLMLLLSLLSLAAILAFAVARPRGWPEAIAAVPAVVLLIAVGAISLHEAAGEAAQLSGVVAFLGAVLVLAKMCDDEGLFEAAGAAMARASSGSGSLLRQVFAIAAIITAVLSLDATVVLLTPVVLTTVRRLRAPVRPHAYATAHLANAASLLLPVSNLTNLLAFHAANVSFIKFTAVMTLPWLAAIGTVYVVFRVFFRRDLSVQPEPQQDETAPPTPVFALVVVALTLVGFVLAEAAGVAPAWAALAGAAVLAVRGLIRRSTSPVEIVRAANVPFLVFVLALGVVVQAVMRNGMSERMGAVLPSGIGVGGAAGVRGAGRRAGQRRQQPARHARAGAAGGIDRAGGGAGRADRGEHRT